VVLLEHLAQAESPVLGDRASRSGERSSLKREIVECRKFLLDSPPRRETLLLGEERARPSEKVSPKRDFALSHYSTLAQARELSLSEADLVV